MFREGLILLWCLPYNWKFNLLLRTFICWDVLRAGGLKKWLVCLQHTRQESGFIVTRGTKLVAFLWTDTQHISPLHLHVAAGQDQWDRPQYWKESYSIQWGSLPPGACVVHVWLGHEWCYRHKDFEPLSSRKKEK